MPKKLKRHIENFIKFFTGYFFASITLYFGQQMGVVEHYTLIKWCIEIAFTAGFIWFIWRGLAGMFWDGDFRFDD